MYLTFTKTTCPGFARHSRFFGSPEIKKVLLVMRLIAFFILAGFLQVSASGKGQVITLSVKNVPLEQVFRSIEKQSDYTFVYFKKDLERLPRINMQVVNVPLITVLNNCFNGTPLTYIIDERNIIIKSRPPSYQPHILDSPQWEVPYMGIVTDENGRPIAGVNIVVKGLGKGVVSNEYGRFIIEANPGDILVFTSIGYESQEIKLTTRRDISLVMKIKTSEIDTAVVNYVSTGYQNIAKERATGAFSHVTTADLNKQIGAGSIDEKFKNLLPGVLVSGGAVTVRGKSSIYANQDPLIIVDGFATTLGLNTINPNDVETITVLRDAAAASIWGARASNGVIVITTKKGSNINGKPVVSLTSTLKVENMPDLADLKLADSRQLVDVELEALDKGWYNLESPDNNFGYSRVYEIYRKRSKGEITDAEANTMYDVLRNTNAFDQKDLFLHKGVFQQHDLSVSGATTQNRYYFSFNYQHNNPYMRGLVDNRFTLFLKNSYQFLPRFRFDAAVNLSYSKAESNGVDLGSFLEQRPYEPFVDANNNYVPIYWRSRSIETNADWASKGYYDWNQNVKRDFDNADRSTKLFAPRISVGLNYNVLKGVNIETSLQHERYDYVNDDFQNSETFATRNLVNTFTVQQVDGSLLHQVPAGTIYYSSTSNLSKITWRNQISVNKDWNGGKHRLNAIAGTELHRDETTTRNQRFFNYNKQTLTYSLIDEDKLSKGVPNYLGQTQSFSPLELPVSETQNRYFSMFFNGAYTFNDKYTVSGSARVDKSNLFGAATNDKIVPLYSIGAAWNISREKFFNVNAINSLKVRATTGINGNVERSTSKVLTAQAMRNFSGTGEEYLKIIWPENKTLRWESTRITNFGLDLTAFKNRFTLNLDYYLKKSYDLLGYIEADPSLGFANVYKNTASVKNTGFDIRANVTVLPGNFNWTTTLNFSFNKNVVLEVYTPRSTVDNHLTGGRGREVKGVPIDYLYSYRWAGLNNQGLPQVYDDKGEKISDIANAQPTVDWLEYSGTRVPPYFGAFINTFSWKGFSLTPILTFEFGNVMRLPTTYLGTVPAINSDIETRWRKPGDEAFTDLPGLYTSMNEPYAMRQMYTSSNNKVANASFVRLSNLSLTYNLPRGWTGNVFNNIQLMAQGTNLAVWKKNDYDIDPGTNNHLNGALWFAPLTSYTFGLKIIL